MKKPVMLLILDGWGINLNKGEKNAIETANPVHFNELIAKYPHCRLEASGENVGLPEGQMGNSEVGHLNIGAGRVVYQPLVEITKDIREGDFFKKPELEAAFKLAKDSEKAIHFIGLLSNGGVHSHIDHLKGLLEMAKRYDLQKVYIHAFLDGRDTAPTSAENFISEIEKAEKDLGVGKIATLSGRYYSMDRDNNWDRVKVAYDAMVKGEGPHISYAEEAIKEAYAEGKTDEFVVPTVIDSEGTIKEGDVVINFNYRPDRAREITRALNDKDFKGFDRGNHPTVEYFCMRQYDATIDAPVIYTDKEIVNTLGEVVSKHGLNQLRTAETEKYAHVTFFFNGGKEEQYNGEERILVASPKVATYDLKPEMAAHEVTEGVLKAIDSDKFEVIVMNLANPDMVGHTGEFDATVKAIKTVDDCLGLIAKKILEKDGVLFVTADHGNAEKMEDPETGAKFTAHTTNKVPFIMVTNNQDTVKMHDGKLADIAPTMLEVLEIPQPEEMTGISLLDK